jgi:hypothetical protein
MKQGRTEAETCKLNGWTVGTKITGTESGPGWSNTDTIEITAIGESSILAKCSHGHGEHTWTLRYREWVAEEGSPPARHDDLAERLAAAERERDELRAELDQRTAERDEQAKCFGDLLVDRTDQAHRDGGAARQPEIDALRAQLSEACQRAQAWERKFDVEARRVAELEADLRGIHGLHRDALAREADKLRRIAELEAAPAWHRVAGLVKRLDDAIANVRTAPDAYLTGSHDAYVTARRMVTENLGEPTPIDRVAAEVLALPVPGRVEHAADAVFVVRDLIAHWLKSPDESDEGRAWTLRNVARAALAGLACNAEKGGAS